MPVYTANITAHSSSGSKMQAFTTALAALHAQTFGTDPTAVRVEFVIAPMEGTRFRYVRL
jgi:hypothetical protein